MSRISEEIAVIKTDLKYIKEAIDKIAGLPDRLTTVEGRVSNINMFQTLITAVSGAIALFLAVFIKKE